MIKTLLMSTKIQEINAYLKLRKSPEKVWLQALELRIEVKMTVLNKSNGKKLLNLVGQD